MDEPDIAPKHGSQRKMTIEDEEEEEGLDQKVDMKEQSRTLARRSRSKIGLTSSSSTLAGCRRSASGKARSSSKSPAACETVTVQRASSNSTKVDDTAALPELLEPA